MLVDSLQDAGLVRRQPLRWEQRVDLCGRCVRHLAQQAPKARPPGAAPVAGVEVKILGLRRDGVETDLNQAVI
jgi:hypothetical protein